MSLLSFYMQKEWDSSSCAAGWAEWGVDAGQWRGLSKPTIAEGSSVVLRPAALAPLLRRCLRPRALPTPPTLRRPPPCSKVMETFQPGAICLQCGEPNTFSHRRSGHLHAAVEARDARGWRQPQLGRCCSARSLGWAPAAPPPRRAALRCAVG